MGSPSEPFSQNLWTWLSKGLSGVLHAFPWRRNYCTHCVFLHKSFEDSLSNRLFLWCYKICLPWDLKDTTIWFESWCPFNPCSCLADSYVTIEITAYCPCMRLNALRCCMSYVMVCHVLFVFLWSGCTSCVSLLPQMEIHNALHWRTCRNILQVQQSNFALHQYAYLAEDSASCLSIPAACNVNKVLNSILMLFILTVVLYKKYFGIFSM